MHFEKCLDRIVDFVWIGLSLGPSLERHGEAGFIIIILLFVLYIFELIFESTKKIHIDNRCSYLDNLFLDNRWNLESDKGVCFALCYIIV